MDTVTSGVVSFIAELSWEGVPAQVRQMLRRCALDLAGTMVAGAKTELSRIARQVAAQAYGGDEATLLFDGRRTTMPGAALANGMTIDAMDMHDGYRPAKGHAGASIFPAALATGESVGWSGQELAVAMVVGYEIGLRAAIALHQTVHDYHTSGAWSALGAAAVAARGLGLTAGQIRHALGIAEYHGPRSPMMRVIDAPSMLKDGAGWGSMAGVLATRLAQAGFSGAPAATVETEEQAPLWTDLGQRWRIEEIYFKPYACCRWAQPAVRAALSLTQEHQLDPDRIANVHVDTFEAAAHLRVSRPRNTEEAQYSLPYPLAAALIYGRLDPEQVMPPILFDSRILALADRVTLQVEADMEARFPDEALARVRVETREGESFQSQVFSAPGDSQTPLSDDELKGKFARIVKRRLAPDRCSELQHACWGCAELDSVERLIALLGPPLQDLTIADD